MSAFTLPNGHINFLLNAGLSLRSYPGEKLRWQGPGTSYRELTEDVAGQVGAVLVAENWRSVNHRYSEEEIEFVFEFQRTLRMPNPVAVIKAVHCYEYQACEHPGWETSEAYRFCRALVRLAINCLPGYGDMPWEINGLADIEKVHAPGK